MSSPNRMAELDAVNQMLMAIGNEPASTLPEDSDGAVDVDAVRAAKTLDRVSLEIQARGHSFNTELSVKLMPSSDGKITLGPDVVQVDATDTSLDLVLRGGSLYDRTRNSDVFTSPVTVDLIRLLSWESLPDHARQYIAARATTRFAASSLGNDSSAYRVSRDFESEALADFKRQEINRGDHNMIRHYRPAGLRKLRW